MKWILRGGLFILGLIILFLVFSIKPIGEQDYTETEAFRTTMAQVEELPFRLDRDTSSVLEVGWAKGEIMPEGVSAMAGYRLRRAYGTVDDSLYCRVFAFKKGRVKAALIELDLLIFPPTVADVLRERLKATPWQFDELYLSASHTHSGAGNWLKGYFSSFITGEYHDAYVQKVAGAVLATLERAYRARKVGEVGFAEVRVPEYVHNRLLPEGGVNPDLQFIKFVREDGSQAALVSYTAHPTTAERKDLAIGNDYPYYLMQGILSNPNIDFCAFFAGPMGSHGPTLPGAVHGAGREVSRGIGEGLATKVLQVWEEVRTAPTHVLGVGKVPFLFDDLHLRVAQHWRTREGMFEAAMGEQKIEIDVVRLGNLALMSTPCDLSGELALTLKNSMPLGQQLMIHNFNGGYVGYITPDKYYYQVQRPETMEMNWLGPHNGSMMMDVLSGILEEAMQ